MRSTPAAALLCTLAACGAGKESPPRDAGLDSSDARTDATDSGLPADAQASRDACVAPVAGQSCDPNATPCEPTDPCCAGYAWTCIAIGVVWSQVPVACPCGAPAPGDAGSFACGSASCAPGTYCTDTPGPEPGSTPDVFACVAAPPGCQGTPTCGCVVSASATSSCVAVGCKADGAGHVTLQCAHY